MRKHVFPRINRIIEELEVALEASSRGKLKFCNRLRLKEIAMRLVSKCDIYGQKR